MRPTHPRQRRALLVTLLLLPVLAAACAPASEPSTPTTEDPANQPPAGEAAPESSAENSLTVGTTEGPYYISGTAEAKGGDLNATKLPGDPIRVSGVVYGGSGRDTPLPGARVEVWHADDTGAYHPNAGGSASDYAASELALRGYVVADQRGRYEFASIYPGYYPGRTRHIHVRVAVEGYGAVVTQLIVPPKPGDGTTPETDAIARSLPASHRIAFTERDGAQVATFDFHLGGD